jgi:FkbM family methyltransferase
MDLQALASHTVDIDLLPEEPVVLDVGCRWFDFTRGILLHRPKARIIAMDPSSDVEKDADLPAREVMFLKVALVGEDRHATNFAEGIAGDGGGNFVLNASSHGDYRIVQTPCTNIKAVMRYFGVTHFDAVKLDCEGSEFGILENWPGPLATQISVEFHDCWKPQIRDGNYYDKLMEKLPWYRMVQHPVFMQGTGLGHWDSLLCLK